MSYNRGVDSPYVIKLIDYIDENEALVMEMAEGGSLQGLLSKRTEPLGNNIFDIIMKINANDKDNINNNNHELNY